jgi:hypothetical protein
LIKNALGLELIKMPQLLVALYMHLSNKSRQL